MEEDNVQDTGIADPLPSWVEDIRDASALAARRTAELQVQVKHVEDIFLAGLILLVGLYLLRGGNG